MPRSKQTQSDPSLGQQHPHHRPPCQPYRPLVRTIHNKYQTLPSQTFPTFKLYPLSDPFYASPFPSSIFTPGYHYSITRLLEALTMETASPLSDGGEGLATGAPQSQLLDFFFPGFSGKSISQLP